MPAYTSCRISFLVVIFIGWTAFEIWVNTFVFHNFPEQVAKPLRKGIYFANIRYDPQRALKFFREALFAAQELGLHPLDDRVMGIKIFVANFFEEKVQSFESAIRVYEQVHKETGDWLLKEGDKHFADGHRSRIMTFHVRAAMKLGELYGAANIARDEEAEQVMADAAAVVMKERLRRQNDEVLEGEGEFLPDEEVGASMEGEESRTEKTVS